MVFYILLVAALNLGLGFALAAYLGRQGRAAMADGDPWSADALLGQSIDDALAREENAAAGVQNVSDQPPDQSTNADHRFAAVPGRCPVGARQPPGATPATTEDPAPERTSGSPPEETAAAQAPPGRQPQRSPVEKPVEDLMDDVQQYHEQVTRADEKLRACAEAPEAAEIEAILGSLKDSTQQYLKDRNEAHGALKQLHQGQLETSGAGVELEAAIQREDQQIESTSAMIEEFDYENDLGEGCRRMSEQTGKLIDSNDQLGKALGEVEVKLAGDQQRPQEVNPATQRQMPQGTPARTELEAELRKRWNKDPDRAPHSSLALIALDNSANLTEHHGQEVADRIFRAVAELLESENSGEEGLSRLSEQRLLLLLSETNARLTTNTAERLRQTIEKTRLRHDGAEIRVTVSCAVVGAESEESPERVLERAETTLQEAKRYGSNRTFLHDGKYPAPVLPPSFSLEEKQVTV